MTPADARTSRDRGYDSNPNRHELRKRRILPVITRKGSSNIKGLGKLRYVVKQAFSLLHHFKCLAVHWERRLGLHDTRPPSPAGSSTGDASREPDHDVLRALRSRFLGDSL
ncbi:hypothetical protein [Streptomyces monashensis]|uniref:hypothetical protein n=1 Tax=Streptomyces monashensis TaxID=1678012 RepID=UPI0015A564E8